jgi:hypothetical protein
MAIYASVVLPPYDKVKAPSLPLPVAYEQAITFLGNGTNQYHCISAEISNNFSSDGEWYFTFYSTNSAAMPKRIAVTFEGKVIEDNGLR